MLFHIIAAFAQFERDNRIDNTRADLDAARARGKKGGRPTKLDAKKIAVAKELRKAPKQTVKEICELLRINRATFYNVTGEPGA